MKPKKKQMQQQTSQKHLSEIVYMLKNVFFFLGGIHGCDDFFQAIFESI